MLKKKMFMLMFQNITQIALMITNGEGWHYLSVKNYQHYSEEYHKKIMVILIA